MKVPVQRYWALLSVYLKGRRGKFILLSCLLLGSVGLQLVVPQFTRHFIDLAKSGAEYRYLILAAIGFLGASLGQQVVSVLARYAGEVVAWSATNDLRADTAEHCLNLDMTFHNEKSPGELIERIDGDILTISKFFSQLVVLVIGSVILLAGIIVALFLEDLRVGAMYTAFSCATLFAFIKLRNIAVPHDKARREKISEMFGYIEERLSGTEDIRSSGAVDFVLLGLYKIHHALLPIWKKAELTHITIRLLAGIAMSVGYGMAFISGYYLYRSGDLTIGTVYLIVHYTEMIARPIRILTQEFQNLQNIGANVERINDIMSVESKITSPDTMPADTPEWKSGPLSVSFDKVNFGYNPEEPVLNNLSLNLGEGKILGLLGRTGSGKTTIARLLLRLYDPNTGGIRLGKTELRQLPLHTLRQRVAMVTQDVQLFQATVRQNLTFFDTSMPDSRLLEVIGDLELGDWLESLPEGLDSKIDVAGKGLSAGEAQLLALTRVFLRNPGLIILDEASSRLDPATEGLIEKVVGKLLENRTAIVIAHRLGTVNRADSILIMSDGHAIEYGERSHLAANPNSRFANLLKTGLEEVLA
ncbi:MAG: ABC transporter ATP-binding protein [Spirochaetales bacterium]|jgi:ATP-binding cassette, subfamily B, bacterial|nr:ABC transporter ATP-binding protein [Spirochaetales bacterium]